MTVALPATLAEISRELLPRRRVRANPRVVKRKMSSYAVKRSEHRRWPQPTRSSADSVGIIGSQPAPA